MWGLKARTTQRKENPSLTLKDTCVLMSKLKNEKNCLVRTGGEVPTGRETEKWS